MKTTRVSKVLTAKTARNAGPVDPTRPRIVAIARALFFQRGFLRVTADDLAAELGISKATLYKAFSSKEEMLGAAVREVMNEMAAEVERLIGDDSLGFVEKMVALFTFVGSRLSQFGPLFLRDIQKGAPRIWKEIDDFRRDKIFRNFRVILEAGRREGFFREDVDLDLLLQMFISLIQEFVNPAAILRSGRPPAATFESVIKVFFQGILTDKGRLVFSAGTPAFFEPRKEGVS
ncbi:MAG: TetR/AcrR family transcriptional regulator [Candidatus Aminicenantes bacterium]|nr:TetR/AcrR family transcriptional regulator [Candidatus Aminicenantes bacterium]